MVSVDPFLLVALLVVGGLIGMLIANLRTNAHRKTRRAENRERWKSWERRGEPSKPSATVVPFPDQRKQPDASDQLRIVMAADFAVQPLLNKKEARVFRELDRVVLGINPGWQVMAQASLGEILRSKDPEAYGCINSKRVDLLLVDEDCRPRHVVEYQGHGHHQGTAAARDAIKKEALRRAGISYHEVVADQTTPSELRQLMARLVPKPNATIDIVAPDANA